MKLIVRIVIAVFLILFALLLLAAFLPVPADVPTGPAQPRASNQQTCPPAAQAAAAAPQTITVQPNEKIQEAIDRAHPGDTVEVAYGVYHEALKITLDNFTLRGRGDNGRRPVLDGENKLGNGVIACGDNFTIENFEVRNYLANGVLVQDVNGVTFRDILADHTGEYGLFPVRSNHVLIERCAATGASDTGLYVGESTDIMVKDSEAYGNVSGFEIENSSNAVVMNNYSHDNTAGMLVFVLPDLLRKETSNNRIVGNRIVGNNLPSFAEQGTIVASVPPGAGIVIMAADHNEFTANEIRDNRSVGVALISLRTLSSKRSDFDVGTESEGNWIHDNTIQNNGTDPSPEAKKFGLPAADLVWDGSGWDNSWAEATSTRFPPWLPTRDWPDFARRVYWRALGVARKFL